MKHSIVFLPLFLFYGFSFLNQYPEKNNFTEHKNLPKFFCPSPPSFFETAKPQLKYDNKEFDTKDIDQGWYNEVTEKIENEEYNITYSKELGSYQSPNRANGIRFVYHKDGFSAMTRESKIPLFDVNDKSIREENKKYRKVSPWKIDFKIRGFTRMNSGLQNEQQVDLTRNEIFVKGNSAFVEDENVRIDYLNDEKGMRQNFIIKNKPGCEGKLRLNLSADTKLKMIVGADALMFKDKNGEDKMKYSSLKCWDANGKILRAYFEDNYKLQNTGNESKGTNQKSKNQKSKIILNSRKR